jgi:hypothetical protein
MAIQGEKQEKDLSYERTNSQMGYVMDDDLITFTDGRRSDVQFDKPFSGWQCANDFLMEY